MTADEVVALLGLRPHPEGGSFTETWRDDATPRGHGTAIYFLLRQGEQSEWHRVDATEVWHFYAGSPLVLEVEHDEHRLGNELVAGERPQVIVPAGAWQRARSTGPWTLAGCTVAPAFRFEGFELAPQGWSPPRGRER